MRNRDRGDLLRTIPPLFLSCRVAGAFAGYTELPDRRTCGSGQRFVARLAGGFAGGERPSFVMEVRANRASIVLSRCHLIAFLLTVIVYLPEPVRTAGFMAFRRSWWPV